MSNLFKILIHKLINSWHYKCSWSCINMYAYNTHKQHIKSTKYMEFDYSLKGMKASDGSRLDNCPSFQMAADKGGGSRTGLAHSACLVLCGDIHLKMQPFSGEREFSLPGKRFPKVVMRKDKLIIFLKCFCSHLTPNLKWVLVSKERLNDQTWNHSVWFPNNSKTASLQY